VGVDERAGSVVFSLLVKLRRFTLIVEAQIDIYVAILLSVLILNNVGSEFSVSLLLEVQNLRFFQMVHNRFSYPSKLVQNRFSIFRNGGESIF